MNCPSHEFCGPVELADALVENREAARRHRPTAYGDISDDGVRRLVLLAYYASQVVEEGDYPRFPLHVAPLNPQLPTNFKHPWELLRFPQPVQLQSVDDLRRLAPGAASHDLAIEIREVQNGTAGPGLEAVSVRLAHSGEGEPGLFSTSIWGRRVLDGMMIRVDGPGELRASEARSAWDLRAGELVPLASLVTQPLTLWADGLAARLARNPEDVHQVIHTLHFAWHEVLQLAAQQQRGGCFVVLPQEPLSLKIVESTWGISIKYPTSELDLGSVIAEFVRLCLGSKLDEQTKKLDVLASDWLRARYHVTSQVEAVAGVSGVDGSTVFDADLRLVGFGGKIKTEKGQPTKCFRDVRSGEDLDAATMEKAGTRHGSAYRLCNAYDSVWCYVVLQDAHVTAFWSDAETVYRWKPYCPWAKPSDHF